MILAVFHLHHCRVAPEGCRAEVLEDTCEKEEEEKVEWEDLILSTVKDVKNDSIEAKLRWFDEGHESQGGDDAWEG